MNDSIKKVWVVEFGSCYSDDPWEVVAVCSTELAAQHYVDMACRERHLLSRNLFHISAANYYEH